MQINITIDPAIKLVSESLGLYKYEPLMKMLSDHQIVCVGDLQNYSREDIEKWAKGCRGLGSKKLNALFETVGGEVKSLAADVAENVVDDRKIPDVWLIGRKKARDYMDGCGFQTVTQLFAIKEIGLKKRPLSKSKN